MSNRKGLTRSHELDSDFDLARNLAEAIGLADRTPVNTRTIPYISNIIPKQQKQRRLKSSDLIHFSRESNSRRVRERNKLIQQKEQEERQKSIRKNSVKDVFVNYEKPEDNPFVYAKTQQIIFRKDIARAHKYEQQSRTVRKMSRDKDKRSKILGDMLGGEEKHELFEESNVIKGYQMLGRNSFYNPLFFFSSKNKAKDETADKLAASFDFSRFNLVSREGALHLQSKEDQRRIQTAKVGRRTVRLKFNESDKCEIQYARNLSESNSFTSSR